MDRAKIVELEQKGKICYECGSKKVVRIHQGYARKYGYCKEHSDF